MRKICIVTGSRAEWGLLSGLARKIADDPELELQIIATNMHLSPEFGLTYREIERQGFRINRKVEMLLSSDTANATGKIRRFGYNRIFGTLTRIWHPICCWCWVTVMKY